MWYACGTAEGAHLWQREHNHCVLSWPAASWHCTQLTVASGGGEMAAMRDHSMPFALDRASCAQHPRVSLVAQMWGGV